MSSGAADPNTRNTNKTKIVVALIGLLVVVVPLIWGVVYHSKPQTPTVQPAKTRSFSGRIIAENQSPIVGASVIATQDQKLGENVISDANGQFQVQVAPETVSLRLTINANGYMPTSIQAVIDRTGPEEIILHAVPKPVTATPTHRNPVPKDKHPTTGQPVPPAQTVNIDHGIGGIGGTYVNPTVINNPTYGATAPAPGISDFKTVALPVGDTEEDKKSEGGLGGTPGVQAQFVMDGDFDHPGFLVTCDKPCRATYVMHQEGVNQSHLTHGHMDPKISYISMTDPVYRGDHIFIWVRGPEPFAILSVKPWIKPQTP